MNLSLRQLRSFAVLAKSGSFTRAAEALHVSQPALTVQIRGLEEQLGLKLFDRNTRQVKLTPVGRELLPTFERLLRDIDSVAESARALAAGVRGVVHVAALPSSTASTLLPGVIAEVRRKHPGIVVRLRDAVALRILALLRAEEVEFGIGTFDRIDADMTQEPLFTDRLVAVMPKGHPLARRKQVTLKDLAREQLIVTDSQSSVRALVEKNFFDSRTLLTPAYEVTYMTTAVALAQAGLGVAMIPSTALELRMLSGLEVRPCASRGFARHIGIVRKSGRSPSPAAEIFVALLRAASARRGSTS